MAYNKAQSKAIAHKEGPMMVLAGPGSGKTRVITKRIEYLIHEYKVRPEEILVITFTKFAANEMKERFYSNKDNRNRNVTFGTFHGIFYGILKWAYGINSTNILSEEEKYAMVKMIAYSLGIELPDTEEKEWVSTIVQEIGEIKGKQLDIETYEASLCGDDDFRQLYKIYEKERKENRKIDFEDMIVLCYQLFFSRQDILKKWQEKYQYILIDEFQDINDLQYQVVKMLAKPSNNLFIVGDDDQSIYKFRGANPEIMLGFQKDYEDAQRIVLETNYRSTKSIITGAKKVIVNNQRRYEKNVSTPKEQGENIHVQEVRDVFEESDYVVNQILSLLKKGVKETEIAIIYRNTIETRTIVKKLMDKNIMFSMREHIPNIYDHFIAQNIISYLKLCIKEGTSKDLLNIVNRPNRYILRDAVEKKNVDFESMRRFYCDKEWMQDRIDQLEVDLRMISRMTPFAAVQYILKKIGYNEYLKEHCQKNKTLYENLKPIIEEIEEKSKEFKTTQEWLENILVYGENIKIQNKRRFQQQQKGILLHTMHSAKGLEFDHVFVIAANEDVIPYKKAESQEEIEEERRMFYVAMTRAREGLTVVYPKEKNGKEMFPSRFVCELIDGI